MTTLESALFWLYMGVSTVPLYYRSKIPNSNALIRSGFVRDNRATWQPLKTQLPNEAQIKLWFEDNKPANLALVCGWQNLVILDFDSIENYAAWYCWQLEKNPKILDTYRVTSSRGIHSYFYLSEPMRLNSIQHSLFEVKSAGRLCTTPPSVHESGKAYRSLDDPQNIKTVKASEILNYSPLTLHPVEVVCPTRSRFAPTRLNGESSLIEQIKGKIKILSFFPNARQLDNEGHFWLGNCPLHGHKDNLWIDAKSGRAGCYAGCGSFDVIELFARLNNISNREAIHLLSKEL